MEGEEEGDGVRGRCPVLKGFMKFIEGQEYISLYCIILRFENRGLQGYGDRKVLVF